MAMIKYPVVFEASATGMSAYVPDLPGCIATGKNLEQTRKRIAEALEVHLSAMREDGDLIPEPSHVELIEVDTSARSQAATASQRYC